MRGLGTDSNLVLPYVAVSGPSDTRPLANLMPVPEALMLFGEVRAEKFQAPAWGQQGLATTADPKAHRWLWWAAHKGTAECLSLLPEV